MEPPTPEQVEEEARKARKRASNKAAKKRRRDADPEYRKAIQRKCSRRLAKRASPGGGDPEFRAKRLAYMKEYNKRLAEKRKSDPEAAERKRQVRLASYRRCKAREQAADPGPQT